MVENIDPEFQFFIQSKLTALKEIAIEEDNLNTLIGKFDETSTINFEKIEVDTENNFIKDKETDKFKGNSGEISPIIIRKKIQNKDNQGKTKTETTISFVSQSEGDIKNLFKYEKSLKIKAQ